MYIDWEGVLFSGFAAGLLLAAIYLIQERKTKTEAFGVVAILFVVSVCLAYSRLFAIAH